MEKIPTILIIEMLKSGLDTLYKYKNYVNSLNVFPVPDGDTGSNMYVTLKDALEGVGSRENKGFKKIINNAIYSSRGNSGTILSMFLKGSLSSLNNDKYISDYDFVKAFCSGCKSARKCLDKPVDGTIITVMEAARERIRQDYDRGEELDIILKNGLKEAQETLKKTPDMLPILKKANVVDAGGQGFVYILQGMYERFDQVYREGNVKKEKNSFGSFALSGIKANLNHTLNNLAENIVIKNIGNIYSNFRLPNITKIWRRDIAFKYDVEFITNVTGKEKEITSILRKYGDSIIVVETDVATKVHVHTNEPEKVFEEISNKIGELRNKTVEDMDQQRNDVITKFQKDYQIVVLIKNYGFEKIIRDFNVDNIFHVNNPSVNEIVKLIDIIDGGKIIFLVADNNLEIVTKQALANAEKEGKVMSFKNEVYLLNAIINYNPEDQYEDTLKKIHIPENFKAVTITESAKDCVFDGKKLKKGEFIAVTGENIIASSLKLDRCIDDAISGIKAEFSSLVTMYVDERYANQAILEKIKSKQKQMEFDIYNVGKTNFIMIMSVE
ncbi:MAG: DAK2 domain-containing protein [Proteobacteria bacterium]|nr:DAK2 domain-containing protein [Pseudomonadota bacterium]